MTMIILKLVACFALLFINMLSCEANGRKMQSSTGNRGKFTLSGSIFGKRFYSGAGEADSSSESNGTDDADMGSPRPYPSFCDVAYQGRMANALAMSPNIWLYNLQRWNAICNH